MNAKDLRVVKNLFGHIPSMFLDDSTTPPHQPVVEQMQSDWDQNNSNADDFIKNRTHYVENTETTIDSESVTIIPDYKGDITLEGEITDGVQYTITIGNNVYVGQGQAGMFGNAIMYQDGDNYISINDFGCSIHGIIVNPTNTIIKVEDSSQNVLFNDSVELEFGSEIEISYSSSFDDGVEYKVCFGEYEYVVVAEYGELYVEGVFELYNGSLTIMDSRYAGQTFMLTIQSDSETVRALDEKFIPDTIVRASQLGGVQFKIDGTDLQASLDGGVSWKTVTLS